MAIKMFLEWGSGVSPVSTRPYKFTTKVIRPKFSHHSIVDYCYICQEYSRYIRCCEDISPLHYFKIRCMILTRNRYPDQQLAIGPRHPLSQHIR